MCALSSELYALSDGTRCVSFENVAFHLAESMVDKNTRMFRSIICNTMRYRVETLLILCKVYVPNIIAVTSLPYFIARTRRWFKVALFEKDEVSSVWHVRLLCKYSHIISQIFLKECYFYHASAFYFRKLIWNCILCIIFSRRKSNERIHQKLSVNYSYISRPQKICGIIFSVLKSKRINVAKGFK